ncbi:MAG: TetR/AcrR family transcriptional regulator [Clostridiales bacterium]|nr:TetR/AcrR family transcriptional regulator [Clostridiales bacterium]
MRENNYDIQEFLQDYAETSPDKEIRIINAAINAFSEKGFEATRTKEIAQRAGIAEGTIFRYFPTKDAILERMVPLLVRVMLPKISGPIDKIISEHSQEPVERILFAILTDRVQMARDNGRFIKSVLPELIHRAPLLNQLQQSILPVIEQYVSKVVDYGKSRGEMDEHLDPHLVMMQLLGFIISCGMFGGESEADIAQTVNAFIHYTMKGWSK